MFRGAECNSGATWMSPLIYCAFSRSLRYMKKVMLLKGVDYMRIFPRGNSFSIAGGNFLDSR